MKGKIGFPQTGPLKEGGGWKKKPFALGENGETAHRDI